MRPPARYLVRCLSHDKHTMPSPHRRPTSDSAGRLAETPGRRSLQKAKHVKLGEAGTDDLEAGCCVRGCVAASRHLILKALFALALVALAAFTDGASRANLTAMVSAKAKRTAVAAATKAKSTATAVLGRPPARARPPTPLDRPAGLPRTAFDAHLAPAMTPGEALTLAWYASQAATYVEYGSGASTVQAAPLAGRALSVENGVAWCAQMTARADVGFWVAQGKLDFVCVDIGETGMKDGEGGVGGKRERGWRGRERVEDGGGGGGEGLFSARTGPWGGEAVGAGPSWGARASLCGAPTQRRTARAGGRTGILAGGLPSPAAAPALHPRARARRVDIPFPFPTPPASPTPPRPLPHPHRRLGRADQRLRQRPLPGLRERDRAAGAGR